MSDHQQKPTPFEERMGYCFSNRELLREALTHKSCKRPYNNERLEFLGDAVLDLIVGEFLFLKFPSSDEGELSKIRASLVNEGGLTILAKRIRLGEALFISGAEESNQGREKASILSNAFEAVMGAIYLESGLERVREITLSLLEDVHPTIDLHSLSKDYKTTLQELTQAKFGEIPEYIILKAEGPDHKKEFEVGVSVVGIEYARAKGHSKKEAQQQAAKIALSKLQQSDGVSKPKREAP